MSRSVNIFTVRMYIGVLLMLILYNNRCEGSYIEDVISKPGEFGYSHKNGPETWSSQFSSCGGRRQSPININDEDCITNAKLPRITWRGFWKPHRSYEMKNTWHSVEVTCPISNDRPTLSGGPLGADYVLSQIHFHWGIKSGSEHSMHNRFYGMEVHLVHYKTEYVTIEAASKKKDGLTVVALFLKTTPNYHSPDMDTLISSIHRVTEGGSNSTLPEHAMTWLRKYLDIEQYYTYQGSLTTPPCTENVRWIILKRHGTIGNKQIEEFKKLKGHGEKIIENRRPVQPLNGRQVLFVSESDYDDYEEDKILFPY